MNNSTVTIPASLYISQWVLLLALASLVLVAYRQLGFFFGLADHGSDRDGLSPGERAPGFTYLANGGTKRYDVRGKWSLIMFADPGCLSCKQAVAALNTISRHADDPIKTVVATSADGALVDAVEEFAKSPHVVRVGAEVATKLYRTHTSPFVYLIDPEGIVQKKGIAFDEKTIGEFLGAADKIKGKEA